MNGNPFEMDGRKLSERIDGVMEIIRAVVWTVRTFQPASRNSTPPWSAPMSPTPTAMMIIGGSDS
eukprot:SAG11_NODE_678_length_7786_cov_10.991804_5_plen_65_part_00